MKKDIGPLGIVGAVVAAVAIIGAVVFFGMRGGSPGFNAEEQKRNDMMVEVSDRRFNELNGGGAPAGGGEAEARSGQAGGQ